MNSNLTVPNLPRWIKPLAFGNAVATGIMLLIAVLAFRNAVGSTATVAADTTATSAATISTADVQQVAAQVLPRGKPFYGAELGITYDETEKGLQVLGQFDAYGSKTIKLTGEKLDRYIKMGMSISCEYCCGAKAITDDKGNPACGCAHSQAMRGVALYLLDKYGDKKTDQEIFAEIAKWKALSFPQDTVNKVLTARSASQGGTTASGGAAALPKQVGGC